MSDKTFEETVRHSLIVWGVGNETYSAVSRAVGNEIAERSGEAMLKEDKDFPTVLESILAAHEADTQDRIVAVLEGLRERAYYVRNFAAITEHVVYVDTIDSTINQVKEGKL